MSVLRRVARRVSRILITITVLCGVVLSVFIVADSPNQQLKSASTPPGTASQVEALVAASIHIQRASAAVLRDVANASNDTWATEFDIPSGTVCVTRTQCVYGDRSGARTIVLYGDSHARQWLPALNTVAINHHARLVLLGQNGCPVVTLDFSGTYYLPSCTETQAKSLSVIKSLHPEMVIVADSTNDHIFTESEWEIGIETTLSSLEPLALRVVVLQDPAVFTTSPPMCISQFPTDIQTRCSIDIPNPNNPILANAEQLAAKASHVPYILTQQWFCTATLCSPVVGNFLTHFDISHITASYSAYLTAVLAEALKPYFTN
jgi:hypothetical protein